MAIVKPEEMDFSGQRFSMIVYGSPGVGKTTLALSAPKPVLVDFDHGISRVNVAHRTPTIIASKYEDAFSDIKSPEMAEFETVVIDTGGAFVTYLKDWAMRTKPSARLKNGEFNSLKGFGYVKSEWADFTNYVKTVLDKNVIYVFHCQEQQDKDGNPTQRLMCEGSVRNTVWNGCDFGGYVQMIGSQRTICFTPEQEYFAKSSHGITGRMAIPELKPGVKNDFISRLFTAARQNIIAEKEAYAPIKERYEKAVQDAALICAGIQNADTANEALKEIMALDHALTSKTEAKAMLQQATDALGLKYSKAAGGYIDPPEDIAEEVAENG